MKRIGFVFILSICMLGAFSQNEVPSQLASSHFQNKDAKFLLFPTQNIHIFLKLNTRTGEVYMDQFSLERKEQIEIKINSFYYPLVSKEEESNGRFFLYPTTNIYNFMLIDQIDGRVWQVQWSFEEDKRFLSRIPNSNKFYTRDDSIKFSDLEYIDKVFYKDGELFDGEAFIDKNRILSLSFIDGRIRYKGAYIINHKNGKFAGFYYTDNKEHNNDYLDDEGNRITKEEFQVAYPDLVTSIRQIIDGLNNKKSDVPKKPVRK